MCGRRVWRTRDGGDVCTHMRDWRARARAQSRDAASTSRSRSRALWTGRGAYLHARTHGLGCSGRVLVDGWHVQYEYAKGVQWKYRGGGDLRSDRSGGDRGARI